jgi:hypothetical protein
MERLRRSDPQALALALRDLEGALVLSAERSKVGRVAWLRYTDDLELPKELVIRLFWPRRGVVSVPLGWVAQIDAVRQVVLLDQRADGPLARERSRARPGTRWLSRLRRGRPR